MSERGIVVRQSAPSGQPKRVLWAESEARVLFRELRGPSVALERLLEEYKHLGSVFSKDQTAACHQTLTAVLHHLERAQREIDALYQISGEWAFGHGGVYRVDS